MWIPWQSRFALCAFTAKGTDSIPDTILQAIYSVAKKRERHISDYFGENKKIGKVKMRRKLGINSNQTFEVFVLSRIKDRDID